MEIRGIESSHVRLGSRGGGEAILISMPPEMLDSPNSNLPRNEVGVKSIVADSRGIESTINGVGSRSGLSSGDGDVGAIDAVAAVGAVSVRVQ